MPLFWHHPLDNYYIYLLLDSERSKTAKDQNHSLDLNRLQWVLLPHTAAKVTEDFCSIMKHKLICSGNCPNPFILNLSVITLNNNITTQWRMIPHWSINQNLPLQIRLTHETQNHKTTLSWESLPNSLPNWLMRVHRKFTLGAPLHSHYSLIFIKNAPAAVSIVFSL